MSHATLDELERRRFVAERQTVSELVSDQIWAAWHDDQFRAGTGTLPASALAGRHGGALSLPTTGKRSERGDVTRLVARRTIRPPRVENGLYHLRAGGTGATMSGSAMTAPLCASSPSRLRFGQPLPGEAVSGCRLVGVAIPSRAEAMAALPRDASQ